MSTIAKSITLGQIAEMTHGEVKGDPEIKVSSICAPEKAGENSISPLWEKKFVPQVKKGTVLFTKRGWINDSCAGVEVDDPRVALIALLSYFDDTPIRTTDISERAIIACSAQLGDNVSVGAGAVIRDNVKIGDNTVIMENVVIDEYTEIGSSCLIEPGTMIYHHTKIGNRCVLHANSVIGCEGFGFVPDPKAGLIKIPQIGIAHLDDGVEIGACSAVDRATFGETYIGPYAKIDSHVKIGHNCEIGGYTIVVAQSGIAGSTKIGRGVIMAAQSGASNHATIGDGCTVGGRGGVSSDIPAGSIVSGFPAQDHKKELRQQAAVRQLPDFIRSVRELAKKVERLEREHEDA
ncbi:UDP-3-O-(3-hydroxymyristoyl)glucosamine N-acyltransferase [Cloacibacillus porcorum]|uniref:UDP-3-O-(3-hydroxymyristoyl)glucosamine N-acyltransferase n=1 Tax=Cloacibacillus porcorum TaxID=1197717 RepID=UPI001459BB75|nr:UDP-3-O-(3-hydroxymyristoyl)glucosamine N-acyltransferase [Cloacibacillus porcorum]MCC8185415.1 UDP-3-O-(3-hydroxymyristoyl)glucosamine N-acyltransferase [Cloacibacillus porcorum]MDD7650124.1 UDP-3-O-(3-hydroxymyristoyl)glucosamine N-acyltransferase [Cloacibacillus porcorum]MDY4094678.1 UDP-3-O-(3-hydroxymyristoyl)glucosamine N-acyltransferase [Cloacibacillus porcorum]MDY5389374.1 UDP-3-O-(3-hydroxymyristoyl)glucosamine N-acyltransferase [Cloacibacillus porcorum]NMF18296.1 UDP-3-O-(3-hydrox